MFSTSVADGVQGRFYDVFEAMRVLDMESPKRTENGYMEAENGAAEKSACSLIITLHPSAGRSQLSKKRDTGIEAYVVGGSHFLFFVNRWKTSTLSPRAKSNMCWDRGLPSNGKLERSLQLEVIRTEVGTESPGRQDSYAKISDNASSESSVYAFSKEKF